MGQIWTRIGRGCPPSTPRHFWIIFEKTHFFVKHLATYMKNHEMPTGHKNVFFLRNHKNQKDAHRHNSKFRGPMTSPSSIWSPFVKKRVLAKNINFMCNLCACARTLCLPKILVHAQESCACTAITCKIDVFFCENTFFSRMGSIWKMGRSSGRQNSSRGYARLFYVYDFSDKKKVFRPVDVSWFFGHFSSCLTKNEFFQKWPRSVWECSGGIPDLSGPMFDTFWRKSLKT